MSIAVCVNSPYSALVFAVESLFGNRGVVGVSIVVVCDDYSSTSCWTDVT